MNHDLFSMNASRAFLDLRQLCVHRARGQRLGRGDRARWRRGDLRLSHRWRQHHTTILVPLARGDLLLVGGHRFVKGRSDRARRRLLQDPAAAAQLLIPQDLSGDGGWYPFDIESLVSYESHSQQRPISIHIRYWYCRLLVGLRLYVCAVLLVGDLHVCLLAYCLNI
jgi:hypothetical protein